MKRALLIFCLLLSFPSEAAVSESTRSESTFPEPVTISRSLFAPDNARALQALLTQDLSGQVAVFDADETLWSHDVGEGFFQWLIQHNHLQVKTPDAGFFQHYLNLCAKDKRIGYPYAAQAMAGLSEDRVRTLAAEYFDTFKHNIYPAQQKLIRQLQDAGATVWIVSASNQWIVEAAAPHFNVPLDKVVGIRVAVEKGQVTERIVAPVTYREGKVAAIQKYIGQQPVLVAGDSMTDYEMLQYAKRVALVINPKDKGPANANIARLAREHRWLIQRWEKP